MAKELTYSDVLTNQKVKNQASYPKNTYISDEKSIRHLGGLLNKGAQIRLHKSTDHENGVCSIQISVFFLAKDA